MNEHDKVAKLFLIFYGHMISQQARAHNRQSLAHSLPTLTISPVSPEGCVCVYMQACMLVCVCMCVCVCVHVCVRVCVHMCVCICVCVCVHACMCACVRQAVLGKFISPGVDSFKRRKCKNDNV